MISFAAEVSLDKAPDAFRTISEVAEDLDLPQHVLRFWETRFTQIKPLKRGGGRRYYRPDDVALLKGIRHLLYGEGYTIKGVQRILKEEGLKFVQNVWMEGAPAPRAPQPELVEDDLSPDPEDDDAAGDIHRGPAHHMPGQEPHRAYQTRPQVASAVAPPTHRPHESRPVAVAHPQAKAAAAIIPHGKALQAILFELGECRRVLALARGNELPSIQKD